MLCCKIAYTTLRIGLKGRRPCLCLFFLKIVCFHSLRIYVRIYACWRLTRKRRNGWIKSLFLFSLHRKKDSRSFIKLRLNHWCHMDYFNNVLTNFLGLNEIVALLFMEGQKALRFHKKYLNLCFEDEQRSHRFGMTQGWVINDRIFIFGWTIPLRYKLVTMWITCK